MRLRNFHKRIKKANDITGIDEIGVGTLTATTATLTTAVVATKLVIPTTPYTGANATIGTIYATGGYLFWSNGTAFVSGEGGLV